MYNYYLVTICWKSLYMHRGFTINMTKWDDGLAQRSYDSFKQQAKERAVAFTHRETWETYIDALCFDQEPLFRSLSGERVSLHCSDAFEQMIKAAYTQVVETCVDIREQPKEDYARATIGEYLFFLHQEQHKEQFESVFKGVRAVLKAMDAKRRDQH